MSKDFPTTKKIFFPDGKKVNLDTFRATHLKDSVVMFAFSPGPGIPICLYIKDAKYIAQSVCMSDEGPIISTIISANFTDFKKFLNAPGILKKEPIDG